jgi:2,3-bisphosphoglycerate-dependent phosphoglycerate mutase
LYIPYTLSYIAMKTTNCFTGPFKVLIILLLLSNFDALAQKTNIFIVREAEKGQQVLAASNIVPGLSNEGHDRAEALAKVLKREKIKAIYTPAGKIGQQTAAPLGERAKILPRIYTDSISAFVNKLTQNFEGSNVLIVAQQKDVLPIISALGLTPPFDELTDEDYDLLFSITIDGDKREIFVTNYGKKHHDTEIPQQYIIQKFNPSFIPPMNSH